MHNLHKSSNAAIHLEFQGAALQNCAFNCYPKSGSKFFTGLLKYFFMLMNHHNWQYYLQQSDLDIVWYMKSFKFFLLNCNCFAVVNAKSSREKHISKMLGYCHQGKENMEMLESHYKLCPLSWFFYHLWVGSPHPVLHLFGMNLPL